MQNSIFYTKLFRTDCKSALAWSRQVSELTSNEINTLTTLYENSQNKASVYARNILLAAEEIEYDAPVIYPDMGNKSSLITQQANNSQQLAEQVYIDVYPNPARDYIIFEYDIVKKYESAQLHIYDGVKSNLLMQQNIEEKQNSVSIGVKDWAPGVYIASIVVDGKILKSIKFTVAGK